jgi:hypothetical protein
MGLGHTLTVFAPSQFELPSQSIHSDVIVTRGGPLDSRPRYEQVRRHFCSHPVTVNSEKLASHCLPVTIGFRR